MAVDFLLFGAHPDDVEWGAGGMLLLLREQRRSCAIVDLTSGEMGSRGSEAERKLEAAAAADFAGAVARDSLQLPDGELVDSPENRRAVAGAIRRHRPKVVIAPYWEDRHPDHAAAGWMVRNSELYATMRKLGGLNPPHKPAAFLYYLLHNLRTPTIVIDIAPVFEKKMQLMRLHKSQFSKTAEEFGVLPLGSPDYLFGLESRDRFFGSLIGTRYGEALVTDRPLRLNTAGSLLDILG